MNILLKLEIKGHEIEMTRDDAKRLYEALDEMFAEKKVTHTHTHEYLRPYWQPYRGLLGEQNLAANRPQLTGITGTTILGDALKLSWSA